jgi:hypothetical protein
MFERITVGDVRVGDYIARTRNHGFERVTRISEGPVARTLYGRHPSRRFVKGEWREGPDIDYIIMRPRRTVKLWREDPESREVRLEEVQVEDEMTMAELRGITAPEF